MITGKLKSVLMLTTAATVVFATGNVLGATRTWTGGAGDGLWHSPANWSGNTVPTLV